MAAPSEDISLLSHSETRHLGITEFESMKALVIRKNQSAEQRLILESITPGMLESRIHSTAKTNSYNPMSINHCHSSPFEHIIISKPKPKERAP